MFPTTSRAADDQWNDVAIADRESFLVQVKAGQNLSLIEPFLLHKGLRVERSWPEFGLAQVRSVANGPAVGAADADSVARTMQALSSTPGILKVGADLRIFAADRLAAPAQSNQDATAADRQLAETRDPNDPLYAEQWAHRRMNVAASWQINQGNPDLAIALIDSGYDVGHDDLPRESLWINPVERDGLPGVDDDKNGFIDDYHGWDWIENDDSINDPYGHGTHVGGIIAAATHNELGIAGLGIDLKILPLRVLDEQGAGQISDLIDALYYAHQKGIRVANLSLVLQFRSDMLEIAVQEASEGGMVMVAASGNNASEVYWPAKFHETLAVAATDIDDLRGAFSNHGPEIDVAAPGVNILSTYRDNGYSRLNGTSMATAHVSALAGLVLSLRPDLSTDQVVDLIRSSAVDVNRASYPGVDEFLGHGRIDFLAALSMASDQLTIRPAQDSGIAFAPGQSALVFVSVEGAVSASPAAGAVVQYDLVNDDAASENTTDHTQQILAGMSVSGVDGMTRIVFPAPGAGAYRLRMHVGSASTEVPVIVHSGAAAVLLTASRTEMVAGSSGLPLLAEIFDASGQPVSGIVPLSLTTNLGRFANGQKEYEVLINGGRIEVLLAAGEKTGAASVSAYVGEVGTTMELLVSPGPPANIATREPVKPIFNWAGADETSICLRVTDQFGNAVSDGTQVQLFADRGTLTESTLTTRDGSVDATLVVPAGVDGVARIWAVASGTDAHTQVDVPIMGHAAWFPSLYAQLR